MMEGRNRFACTWFAFVVLALAPFAMANAQVSVTAANPSSAEQGTIALDVEVSGSGFNSSANVTFYVTGTADTGGITVRKVTVTGSKKLIATIDVAENALVTNFDIEVKLSNGRKGKGTTLFAVKQKGKPTPPPPPPPTTSCSGAPGTFPAFSYAVARYTIKGQRQIYDGSDVYIANSTGSCSILISPEGAGGSYRQIGQEGMIAYSHAAGYQIKVLRFRVQDGRIVEALPLSPSIVYSAPTDIAYGVNDVELSADGQTIYFTDEYSPAEKHWQNTLKSIDLASCTSNCTPQVLYTFALDNGVAGLSVNTVNDRLYMSIHDRVPDIRTISYLQKESGVWSSLRHVVSHRDDASYSDIRGFGRTTWALWDYQHTAVPKDVVAYTLERTSGNTVEIMDVTNCVVTPVGSSCFASDPNIRIRDGIVGTDPDFTSNPALLDPGPNLLVTEGSSLVEVDLDSLNKTQLVTGGAAESAD
jgi:hypothetical protein